MAYCFGDSYDLYAAPADALSGYWDSGATTGSTLVAGRFSGSQCWQNSTGSQVYMTKSSGANDAVHHIVCAYRTTSALTGSAATNYFQLLDGTTGQCCIVFRSDGAIMLTSGTATGTTLATYTGAVTATSTWFAFEFEVQINNTTGSFTARKNGNTANDFTAGSLNTRVSANNYANKLSYGCNTSPSAVSQLDDLLWRSDPAAVAWIGDVRCYTRMPAADVQAQFSRAPATAAVTPLVSNGTASFANATPFYAPFTASCDGTIGSAVLSVATGYTGNLKCSIFASSGSAPTTVLGSATTITNPAAGNNTFTFGTPVTVTKGAQYYIGFATDTSSGTFNRNNAGGGLSSTTAYASFPVANPGTTPSAANSAVWTLNITVGSNATLVNEAQQDGATTYVYDSNVGDADFYSIAALSGTPTSTIAVTTRGFCQKSDAGTRNAAVQLRSGGTTVTSTSTALSTSFGWLWRVDTVDPNTGTAWTAAAVNNLQVGPVCTA